MTTFQFEWWTVKIKYSTGIYTVEYKGKNKESVLRQIEKDRKQSNSEENLQKPWLERMDQILDVDYDSLTLNRKGYQRRF